MKAYRIGTIQQPWTNLQPPIQGGVHRKLTTKGSVGAGGDSLRGADAGADTDTDLDAELGPISRSISISFTDTDADTTRFVRGNSTDSDSVGDTAEVSSLFSAPPAPLSSNNSSIGADDDAPPSSCRLLPAARDKDDHNPVSTTSSLRNRVLGKLDAGVDAPVSSCRPRNANNSSITSAPASGCGLGPAMTTAPNTGAPTSAPLPPADRLSRETYTAALEQKEIADGIRNYPSLDPETQGAIRAEYRALHKLVQDGGHYKCRYEEYGKEMIRYTALFGAFLYFLSIEWYITSAGFLGFFWVGHPPPPLGRSSPHYDPFLGTTRLTRRLHSNKSCSSRTMLAIVGLQAIS